MHKSVKEVVIGQDSPVTCYRWFALDQAYSHERGYVAANALIRPLNSGLDNPWVNRVAKADALPRMRKEDLDPFTGVRTVNQYENPNGLYCYKTKEHVLRDGNATQTMILAKIRIWGNCVEHEDGYRAQFAQILAIFPTKDNCQTKVTKKKVKAKRVFRVKAKLTKDRTVTLRQEKVVSVIRKTVKRIPFETTFRKDCKDLNHVLVIPCNKDQLSI